MNKVIMDSYVEVDKNSESEETNMNVGKQDKTSFEGKMEEPMEFVDCGKSGL